MTNSSLMSSVDLWTHDDFEAKVAEAGSERKLCERMGMARSTFQQRRKKARMLAEGVAWSDVQEPKEEQLEIEFTDRLNHQPVTLAPPAEDTRRFILTAAQDQTNIHEGFWENLKAYAAHLDAQIMVSGFTYNKRLFEDHSKTEETAWYHPAVRDHLVNYRVDLGARLAFCGEMNTLPTAVRPLSGFETYTGPRWGIFPHAKVALESVPTAKDTPVKMNITTGCVTLPNYIPKRAGLKAEFHHVIGALIVEFLPSGDFFTRHLLAEPSGAFYDLTRRVEAGKVTDGHRVNGLQYGDIHFERIDPSVFQGAFIGTDSMLEWLMPRHQFLHDTTDFQVRNHHNINDPLWRFRQFHLGETTVEESMKAVAEFLHTIQRRWCRTVVVESNHDLAFVKWLSTADYRGDPANALFFLDRQKALYEEIAKGSKDFSIFEDTMRAYNNLPHTEFLREDDSFVIAGDIECGMHGHLGANGARPSPRQFTKMGRKANTGHTHSASIIDGIYTAGTSSLLDLDYNRGLSSWSHSHIVTYDNGKRTIITMTPDGRWCAE